jgi:hypothetical protein
VHLKAASNAELGYFTMDMQQATGAGGVPNIVGVTASNGAALVGGAHADGDKSSAFHAVVMAIVFFFMYPFTMVLLEVFKWRKVGSFFHILLQILLLVAFAMGIYVSLEYIRVSIWEEFE